MVPALLRISFAMLAHPAKDILGGRFRGGLVVDEPEGIGDLPIAKHYRDVWSFRTRPCRADTDRRDGSRVAGHLQRAGKVAFVGRQPAESEPLCSIGIISGQTEPSDGHRPTGARPNVACGTRRRVASALPHRPAHGIAREAGDPVWRVE